MRVLSKAFTMKDSFTQDVFFRILEKWLESSAVTKPLGEHLASCPDRTNTQAQAKYCSLETLCHSAEADGCSVSYTALKMEHQYYSQSWTTEVILKENDKTAGTAPGTAAGTAPGTAAGTTTWTATRTTTGAETVAATGTDGADACGTERTVYIHISNSDKVTRNHELPVSRSSIIRAFTESGYTEDPVMPFSPMPIEGRDDTDGVTDWLVSAMTPGYADPLPVIIVSQCFNCMAYEIDESLFSKKLIGIAYVVTADYDYTNMLKSRYSLKPPYGGAIAIYSKGELFNQYQLNDTCYGIRLDKRIEEDVLRLVSSGYEKAAPTWNSIVDSMIKAESRELNELLSSFNDDNRSLEDRLKAAKKKVEDLWHENERLREKNSYLQSAVSAKDGDTGIISKGDAQEFFDGEQHDLVVTVLQNALTACSGDKSRYRDLLENILESNRIEGNGKALYDEVKRIFSGGNGEINAKVTSDLRRLGFNFVSDSRHYKLVLNGNNRYSYTIAKSGSDCRSGKNLTCDILSQINIYRKAN